MEKGYVFFGKHILSTTYPPIPIHKGFNLELSPLNIRRKIFDMLKSIAKINIVNYVFVFVSIKDIYESLLIISHIDDNEINDKEIMQFFEELSQSSII